MKIIVNRKIATEISDKVVQRILGLYPEENIEERDIFQNAYSTGQIKINDLKSESASILVPWQMFLLDDAGLEKHILHIEEQRQHKVSSKLIDKRKGSGATTSKRIIDRLIRLQEHLLKSKNLKTLSATVLEARVLRVLRMKYRTFLR